MGSPRKWSRVGEGGMWMSDAIPNFHEIADEMCVVHSMHTDQFNHAPAELLVYTGSPRSGRPSMGSWVTYGLGSVNQNVPGFKRYTVQFEEMLREAVANGEDEGSVRAVVERLVAARDQNIGLSTLRQVFLGRFDLAIHAGPSDIDLDRATRDAFALTLIPYHDGTHFSASFGHLMSGYDAVYYGYQWAKVYGDDMFSVFSDEGILSPDVGGRYRNEVLARGYSRDAIEHLRAFLGREPSSAAYLENLGLTE